MAGGKETPRQKMIGMMYLVLTALLALNVSKSILDAFVAIEENTQKSNISHFQRGSGFMDDVKSEMAANVKPEFKDKLAKLKSIYVQMEEIDKISSKMIQSIDALKLELLKESGEDVSSTKFNSNDAILWTDKYKKGDESLPFRMHLMAVQAKDQYDVPMHIIIGDDIKNPTGKGKKLWNDLLSYRRDLIKILGTYNRGGKSYSIDPKAINAFNDNFDLAKNVDKMIKASKANMRRDEQSGQFVDFGEDGQALKDIYISLTKPERVTQNEVEGVHWIGQTFDHSPLVASLASLSSLQQDVLSARAAALQHLKLKVTTGEYSFNKVVSLAMGPAFANAGEDIEVKVMMAAYDSDNQPTVTATNGTVQTAKDGQAIVKAKVSGGGEMIMSGTVSIKKKSGEIKEEPWSYAVKIMKPSGAISLPGLNVLYRGYDNVVSAVASGFDQTNLNGTGLVSITKSGEGWIVKPGSSRDATLTVSGTNSITKKTSTLLTQKYRVMNLPDPVLYWGGSSNGEKGPKTTTGLFARFGPGIPLDAAFKIISWECKTGAPGAPPKGTGSNLSPQAINLIGQMKSGMNVTINCWVVGPDNVRRYVTGSYSM